MKHILLTVAFALSISSAYCQFHVTINTGPSFPQGVFYDNYVLGFGASLAPQYSISSKIDLGVELGYRGFSGNGLDRGTLDILFVKSILGTAKYYLTTQKLSLYMGIGGGGYQILSPEIIITGIPIAEESTTNEMAVAPSMGIYFGRIHFGGSYHMVSKMNFVQLNLGVRIGSRSGDEKDKKEKLSPFPPDYELDYLIDDSGNDN